MFPTLRKPTRSKPTSGVCGLHLEQSEAIAAVAGIEGGLTVHRAAAADLPLGAVRDGEVIDPEALGNALKRLFAEHRLPKRVRVGIANQRTIMRTIDLPPLERDAEIAAAVRMHAPEHIAMPLDQAVTDHHVLGLVDTPDGPRMRVVVAAPGAEGLSDDALARAVLEAGADQLGEDLRTSIEFFASQWGGSVSEVVLTGTALAVPGFAAAVEKRTGLTVRAGEVHGSPEALGGL